jgi:hypothetical protein
MIVQQALRVQLGNSLFIVQVSVLLTKVMMETPFRMVSHVFMKHFDEIALDRADLKPAKWLSFVETFVVWPHKPI